MNHPNLKFIAPIETDFEKIQSDYLNLSRAFTSGKVESFKRLRETWDNGEWMTHPLSRIREAVINYYEAEDFKQEVRNNLFTNHLGAIEFTKMVFAKQDRFIKQQFSDAVIHYFNDVEESQWLVELLMHQRDTMTDAEFYKAVQFQYIQYFKWLEEQFYWIYPLYQPYLLGFDDFKKSFELPEHIQLMYGNNNDAVIKDLHQFLYPTFIDNSHAEFAAHFEDNGLYTKMRWKRAQKALAILFYGIKTGKDYQKISLKMRNRPSNVINQHFLNKKDEEITVDNAEKSKEGINPNVSSRDGDEILQLLKMLNEKYLG
jgi:hypothetical protein